MTASYTKRTKEETNRIGQKYRKGATKDYFIFDSCFSSKKAEEPTVEVDAKFVVMLNTNNKELCKGDH